VFCTRIIIVTISCDLATARGDGRRVLASIPVADIGGALVAVVAIQALASATVITTTLAITVGNTEPAHPFLALIYCSRIAVIANAAHASNAIRPALLALTVRKFLRKTDPAGVTLLPNLAHPAKPAATVIAAILAVAIHFAKIQGLHLIPYRINQRVDLDK